MAAITLRGRGVIPGIVEGEALVCPKSITGWGGIDPQTGIIKEYENVNRGKSIKSKILVLPGSKGSNGWSCYFGAACRWLNLRQPAPRASDPLPDLLDALDAAVVYLRSPNRENAAHDRDCTCETCTWLHDAKSFLRQHHHHH